MLSSFKPSNFSCGKFNIDFLWLDGNFGTARDGCILTARNGVGEGNVFSCVCLSVYGGGAHMITRGPVQTCSLGNPPPAPAPSPYRNPPPEHVQTCSLGHHHRSTDWLESSGWKAAAGLRLKGLLVFFN